MDISEQLRDIYGEIQTVEHLVDQVSIEWIERNFIILMNILDLNSLFGHDINLDHADQWACAMGSNNELAFHSQARFSDVFTRQYELWYTRNDDAERIVMGSFLNDFCLSELVYEHIKPRKEIFACFWEQDETQSWERAVYLFERYNKQPFSLERWEKVHG